MALIRAMHVDGVYWLDTATTAGGKGNDAISVISNAKSPILGQETQLLFEPINAEVAIILRKRSPKKSQVLLETIDYHRYASHSD